MKKSKIAEYARMASNEAHEEYMELSRTNNVHYIKDVLSEIIDKLDHIEVMANRRWYHKFLK
jgi:hypothetical protein